MYETEFRVRLEWWKRGGRGAEGLRAGGGRKRSHADVGSAFTWKPCRGSQWYFFVSMQARVNE